MDKLNYSFIYLDRNVYNRVIGNTLTGFVKCCKYVENRDLLTQKQNYFQSNRHLLTLSHNMIIFACTFINSQFFFRVEIIIRLKLASVDLE